MSPAAKRVRNGALILAAVILIAVPVYRFTDSDFDWTESLWFGMDR